MSNICSNYQLLLSFLICVSALATAILSQEALQLERDCFTPFFYGYVLPPSSCTCKKTDLKSQGVVEWVFSNGTAAPQVTDVQNGTSTLTVQSPYKYALNQTYICRLQGSGQNGPTTNYTSQFIFGPESPSLKWAQEPSKPLQLCASSNETSDLKLYCDVPAATINPSPVYTAFVDGNRYGAYDKLPGQLVENGQVWRLEIAFKLRSPGNHTVRCHVRNLYANANWFTLAHDVVVSDEKSSKC